MKLFATTLLFLGSLWAKLPQTIDGVTLSIEQTQKEIERERKLWAEEKERDESSEKTRDNNYQKFLNEKQTLKVSLEKSLRRIQNTKEKIEVLKHQKKRAIANLESLNQVLLTQTLVLNKELTQTIPYRFEQRIEQVKLLASDIRKQKISPEEAFTRLWNLYRREIQIAGDADVYQGTMHLPQGEETEVKFLRLGKQVLAYANATGNHLGLMLKKENGEWGWQHAQDLDFEARQAIRQSVAVAEGKAIPGFTAFPFWLHQFSTGEQ